MSANQNGLASYVITRATGMQNDTILAGTTAYTGEVYAPDGHEDVDFNPILRSMLEEQANNLRTLHYFNAQDCSVTQGTFLFNSYFTVADTSSGTSDDYSLLYDTRSITAEEAGVTYQYQPYQGYVANSFPETEIAEGQYFSLLWRMPSNNYEMRSYTLKKEYTYIDSSAFNVLTNASVASITGQSFRYSGNVSWQDWSDSRNLLWIRFYIEDEKEQKTYLTPKLTPKWCDEPDTVYLYWVNEMGGTDFVRGLVTKTLNHEDSTYETNTGINDRLGFATDIYHQRKYNSYTFNTKLVSDDVTRDLAGICGARWAWLRIPGETPEWRSVTVKDSQATVKTFRNQGAKLYNYTFELEDNIKNKTV